MFPHTRQNAGPTSMERAMTRSANSRAACKLALLPPLLVALSACTTTQGNGTSLVVGQEADIEGMVVSVDTAPWAYDGNAVVTVATATAGTVKVQLPARWNLCKAQPHQGIQELKPRDRVRAVGTVAEDNQLVVCAQPQHLVRKRD